MKNNIELSDQSEEIANESARWADFRKNLDLKISNTSTNELLMYRRVKHRDDMDTKLSVVKTDVKLVNILNEALIAQDK